MLYDKDIREPLCNYMEDTYGKIRCFDEIVIAKARADIMAVRPGEIIGVEIKSNADTYARLKSQVANYNKFCDRNYVVVGLRHLAHVAEHIPDFWGIICIYEDNRQIIVEEKREALANPKLRFKFQMRLLWKRELHNILDRNHLPKYRQKSKNFIIDKLMEKIPEAQLKEELCQELFERDYSIFNED